MAVISFPGDSRGFLVLAVCPQATFESTNPASVILVSRWWCSFASLYVSCVLLRLCVDILPGSRVMLVDMKLSPRQITNLQFFVCLARVRLVRYRDTGCSPALPLLLLLLFARHFRRLASGGCVWVSCWILIVWVSVWLRRSTFRRRCTLMRVDWNMVHVGDDFP